MDLVIHPVKVATRKFGGVGVTAPSTLPTFQVLKSHAAYLSSVEIPRCFDVFTGIIIFINLPVPFHWLDDKSGIGTVIHFLYTFRSLQSLL